MSDLAILLPMTQELLWAMLFIFIRVGAMIATLPVFGEQTIPVRVRIGITLAFCFILFPSTQPLTPQLPNTLLSAIALLSPEVIAGLFFGLMLRFFVFVLQITGSIAAQSTSLSQIFGGSAGSDPQPAIGHVLVVSGLALATLLGLHVHLTEYMLNSYMLVPMGVLLSDELVVELGLEAVKHTFELGFTLAAPFMIGSLIYNITLGVINKAMPQLMVSFVGAPAITAGGLILLTISAPIILSIWLQDLEAFVLLFVRRF